MSKYGQAPDAQSDSDENDFDEPCAAAEPAKAAKPAKAADDEEDLADEAGNVVGAAGNDNNIEAADSSAASKTRDVRPECDSFAPPSGSPVQLPNSGISGAGYPSASQSDRGWLHSTSQAAASLESPSCNAAASSSPFEGVPQNASTPASSFDATRVTPYSSYVAASEPAGKGKSGIAALIVGIAAIVFCFAPIIGIVLGVVAIVLAGKSIKRSGKNGKAVAGRICGIVGLALSALMFVAGIVFAIMEINYLDSSDDIVQMVLEELPSSEESDSSTFDEKEEAEAQKVVAGKLDALAEGDASEISAVATLANSGFYEQIELNLSDIGVDPQEYAHWVTENITYDIDSAYVWSDGTATVYVDITTRDVFAFIDDFATRLDAFANSAELDGISSDEELMVALGDLFRASMESSKNSYTDNYAMINLTKKGSTWVLDQDSWDSEIDYMFGLV